MRKKSKYKPRPVILDPMSYVQSGMKTLSQVVGELVRLKIRNHDALLALVQGKATFEHMLTLTEAGNMTQAFAYQGIGNEWAKEISSGEDALLAVAQRSKWVCRASELAAIRELLEVHDAQLDVVTVSQIEKAFAHIRETIRHKRAKTI